MLVDAAGMLRDHYGIGRATLHPEPPQRERASIIRLWPRNSGS
jgi:hypothetical protein